MILDEIVESKKKDVERLKVYLPVEELKKRLPNARPVKDFVDTLIPGEGFGHIRIIAEIKRASPSKGLFKEGVFYPFEIARVYEVNGAAAVSVLTEENYFKGNLEYLVAISRNLKIPILRKDFIFDEYQVYESRVSGADSLLLIASILEKEKLHGLVELSRSLGMEPLVEVHSEEELKKALEARAGIIGINNRDLKTFKTDINISKRLAPLVPEDRLVVAESGISTLDDILELREAGVSAFLIGEAFMVQDDLGAMGRKLKELRGLIPITKPPEGGKEK